MSIATGIPGIFFGIVSLIGIGNNQDRIRDWTFAVVGLILSCVSILWLLLFLLLCADNASGKAPLPRQPVSQVATASGTETRPTHGRQVARRPD
jgi:hypothetical protein